MIRIRCLQSTALPLAKERLRQVQEIFRQTFPDWLHDCERIPELLANPFRSGYQAFLLISETATGKVSGFALLLHYPSVNVCHLDYLGVRSQARGSGLGSALYEAAREFSKRLRARGLYMDVDPDDPALVDDEGKLRQNQRRLRFYEQFGARPIINTRYATYMGEPPSVSFLVYDPLGREEPLRREECRAVVRCILAERYRGTIPLEKIEDVVASIGDDPVQIRPPKYVRRPRRREVPSGRLEKAFTVVVTKNHQIHHVVQRGYQERPARLGAIRKAVDRSGLFSPLPPQDSGLKPILAVHDAAFVRFLRDVSQKVTGARPFYADTFPPLWPMRRPQTMLDAAGYYCADSFTPISAEAYRAALAATHASVTAADAILAGRPVAYAMCRPPGHHAGRATFGGFCYFNNTAIAVHRLSGHGRVAVLDIDYHHGNGTQDIFYRRADVLTVSIHGHPETEYPYFSGYADERGEGTGLDRNLNLPLRPGADNDTYLKAFARALGRIRRFDPEFLVLAVGMDLLRGDPTGTFRITTDALGRIGEQLAHLHVPLLVVQEGGYNLRNLRQGTMALFQGIARNIRLPA